MLLYIRKSRGAFYLKAVLFIYSISFFVTDIGLGVVMAVFEMFSDVANTHKGRHDIVQ